MSDWAEKKASGQTCPQCAEQYGMGDNGDVVHMPSVARLLRQEHQRAVRICKKYQKAARESQSMMPSAKAGYELACKQFLAALERGRGKGGK